MPLAHAILASLDFQPMTGYDLKKFFDQSVGHFWTTTQSHIYKALNDLESQGWAQKQPSPRKTSPTGRSIPSRNRAFELRRWLTTPLPPTPVREAWLIQIFFRNSSNEEITALLEARLRISARSWTNTRRKRNRLLPLEVPPGLERAQALWQTTLDYGRAYYEFVEASGRRTWGWDFV